MAGLGRTWCVVCGFDIEGGGSRRQWKEEKDKEEHSSLDSSHFWAAPSGISISVPK